MIRQSRRRNVLVLLCLLLTLVAFLSLVSGEPNVENVVSPKSALLVLADHLPLVGPRMVRPVNAEQSEPIVWEVRLPRIVAGILVGMLLAMAGVAFQGLLMNPLADPYVVGVSAGAALGSVTVILLGGASALLGLAQPIGAFCAGLAAMISVYLLASYRGRLSAHTFLLAGIVVGTFFWSLIPLSLSLAVRNPHVHREQMVISQLLGSLESVGWPQVFMLLPFGMLGGIVLGSRCRELDLMAVGEESAAHMGVETEQLKRSVILAGSLVTAAAVSACGIVAFVGLVVPHIARRLVGANHAILLPVAMLLGGLLLVGADLVARVLLDGLEVGVVTSLIGAPLFCYILRSRMAPRW